MTGCAKNSMADFHVHLSGPLDEDTLSLAMPLIFNHDEYSVCATQFTVSSDFQNVSQCSIMLAAEGRDPLVLSINALCHNHLALAARLNAVLGSQRCLNYFGVQQSPINVIASPANESVRIEALDGGDLPPYSVVLNKRLAIKLGFAHLADVPIRAPFNEQNARRTNLAYMAEQVVVKCGIVEPYMYNDEMWKVLTAFKCERTPLDGTKHLCKLDFTCPLMHTYESSQYVTVAAGNYSFLTLELCDTEGNKLIYPRNTQFSALLHFQRLL